MADRPTRASRIKKRLMAPFKYVRDAFLRIRRNRRQTEREESSNEGERPQERDTGSQEIPVEDIGLEEISAANDEAVAGPSGVGAQASIAGGEASGSGAGASGALALMGPREVAEIPPLPVMRRYDDEPPCRNRYCARRQRLHELRIKVEMPALPSIQEANTWKVSSKKKPIKKLKVYCVVQINKSYTTQRNLSCKLCMDNKVEHFAMNRGSSISIVPRRRSLRDPCDSYIIHVSTLSKSKSFAFLDASVLYTVEDRFSISFVPASVKNITPFGVIGTDYLFCFDADIYVGSDSLPMGRVLYHLYSQNSSPHHSIT